MTKLKEIELMNETMLRYLEKMKLDTRRNEIIKQLLQDEACFFKIDKEDAYMILKDVGISNHMKETYWSLVSREEYYRLQQNGKIKEKDELKIRYDTYQTEELFKNRTKH